MIDVQTEIVFIKAPPKSPKGGLSPPLWGGRVGSLLKIEHVISTITFLTPRLIF